MRTMGAVLIVLAAGCGSSAPGPGVEVDAARPRTCTTLTEEGAAGVACHDFETELCMPWTCREDPTIVARRVDGLGSLYAREFVVSITSNSSATRTNGMVTTDARMVSAVTIAWDLHVDEGSWAAEIASARIFMPGLGGLQWEPFAGASGRLLEYTTGSGGQQVSHGVSARPSMNAWHEVELVVDLAGAQTTLRMDGSEVATATFSLFGAATLPATTELTVGMLSVPPTFAGPVRMRIDNLRYR